MGNPEYHHQYYLDNMEKIKERGRRFYQEHRDVCLERAKKSAWGKEHPEGRRVIVKRCEQNLKRRVLTHYGGGELVCVKCGFNDIRALSIDHLNNNGYEHRKEMKRTGVNFYRLLEKQEYPRGYQTLCMNCNFIKREVERECYPKSR